MACTFTKNATLPYELKQITYLFPPKIDPQRDKC